MFRVWIDRLVVLISIQLRISRDFLRMRSNIRLSGSWKELFKTSGRKLINVIFKTCQSLCLTEYSKLPSMLVVVPVSTATKSNFHSTFVKLFQTLYSSFIIISCSLDLVHSLNHSLTPFTILPKFFSWVLIFVIQNKFIHKIQLFLVW